MLVSRASFVISFSIFSCLFLATLFFFASPKASTRIADDPLPLLEYTLAQKKPVRVPIITHGITRAKTQISLVTEVGGKVVKVNENFAAGGFFKAGETLLEIDSKPYELELLKKQSAVDAALLALKQAEAKAVVAAKNNKGNAALGLHKPQLQHAKSRLAAAEADLQHAKYKLKKSLVTAPFDGRIQDTRVGLGQYLRQGETLANLYALDKIEVRLPISDRQLSLMESMSFLSPHKLNGTVSVPAKLKGKFAGELRVWQGRVVRAEGGRDSNGLLYLVAEVDKPYAQSHLHPLEPGMFVEVEIRGRVIEDVVVLPPEALREDNKVWVVDSSNRLRARWVDLLYRGKSEVYIHRGLNHGERVALTHLDLAINNMRVKLRQQSVAMGTSQ